jgi:hypothetical protein
LIKHRSSIREIIHGSVTKTALRLAATEATS